MVIPQAPSPHEHIRAFVKFIYENRAAFNWTLQGFGMLRLHLPDNRRLHIWDSRFRVPGVSDIHDHLQWGLSSYIVSGSLTNRIWVERPDYLTHEIVHDELMQKVTLKPGVGTHFKNEPDFCFLQIASEHRYKAGDTYSQAPSVIHQSLPEDGTITLMTKFPTDDESARVFWPHNMRWVSAEPRRAAMHEVDLIFGDAMRKFDHDR
jgi:hypothetical protein